MQELCWKTDTVGHFAIYWSRSPGHVLNLDKIKMKQLSVLEYTELQISLYAVVNCAIINYGSFSGGSGGCGG